MGLYPKPIQNLIDLFSRFPGVGPRQAARFVFHLLGEPPEYRARLAEGITKVAESLATCARCRNIEELLPDAADGKSRKEHLCSICRDEKRDQKRIAVVESVTDLRALEKSKAYTGLYHVLGGSIVAAKSVRADVLRLKELIRRAKDEKPDEVIIATSPTTEGDATMRLVERELKNIPAKITRLARGLAKGVDIEYVDEDTLREALTGRR